MYTLDGIHIRYKDFSTSDEGNTFELLKRLFGLSFNETIAKIQQDIINRSFITVKNTIPTSHITYINGTTKINVKTREWRDYDIQYWESYGVTLPWLKWAEVYPISHKIIDKDGKRYTFIADKYAYCYVEHKENTVTLKIYQPYNTKGYKWSNNHDRSVVSLWTKIPEYGDKVVICSSLKDALCLSANTKIPAIAIQGEGYGMSDTAITELKRRFTRQYISLDGDKAGIKDAAKLANDTGFINIPCPLLKTPSIDNDFVLRLKKYGFIKAEFAKDWSDIYLYFGKDYFRKVVKDTLLSF